MVPITAEMTTEKLVDFDPSNGLKNYTMGYKLYRSFSVVQAFILPIYYLGFVGLQLG